jgi:hypothetical protein
MRLDHAIDKFPGRGRDAKRLVDVERHLEITVPVPVSVPDIENLSNRVVSRSYDRR